ncbi:MAG: sugar ABC transporter permease [Anaerolineae bacterium]
MSATDVASIPVRAPVLKTKATANRKREVLWGYAFLSPWVIGFLAFQFLPILFTFFLSFTDYSATREFAPGNFNIVGLDNYARLFSDPMLLNSFGVTLKFAAIGIPLGLLVPLLFAVLVNSKHLIGTNYFRTLFFMPTVIPIVAGAMIFSGVLNSQSGWINLALQALGISDPPRWFSDPMWAVPALNLLGIWGVGNMMIILLASLQGVPTELYEAATVDGANAFDKFFNITVPMISPVIFYNLTLGVIGAFQYFVPAMLIGGRNGDPQGSLLFFPLHFYREAFVFNEMGYASVLAIILFVISMAATGLLLFTAQRMVYYAGSDR